MTPKAAHEDCRWVEGVCATGRTFLLFAWFFAVLGPLGLTPAAGHNHTHPGNDAHCAACLMASSGATISPVSPVPVLGYLVWEPLASTDSVFFPETTEISFLRRAPPRAF
jgi:hypothetical protein